MKEALRQARKGIGRTSPNPAVGAVIVRQGKVIASGYHKRAGAPHAEVEVLSKMGEKAKKGDTLYVTLEPCLMCAAALKWAQMEQIIFGASDPKEGFTLVENPVLHKRTRVVRGILEAPSSTLLSGRT